MTHSTEQMRKKTHAMKESMNHHKNSTVLDMRDGKDHEDHKMKQMIENEMESRKAMNRGVV